MRQRLTAFWQSRAALPKACYLLAALLWLAQGVYGRLYDTALDPHTALPTEAFELADLTPAGELSGAWITTSGDPQMVLTGLEGQRLRTVSYVPEWLDGDPWECCLYYVNSPGEPFSQDKRVFPRVEAGGRYVYTLPRGRIAALRIDPCSPAEGQTVTFAFLLNCVDLNYPTTLPRGLAYFLPSWYQLFCLLLYPALAAAALDWLRAAWRHWRGKNA